MSKEEPPEWLPDGWIMEVRRGKKGHTFRYYTCPESDYTFCSREEVMRYLNSRKVDSYATDITKNSRDGYDLLVQKVKDSLDWLPRGWIMEIRIQKNGLRPEHKYKCYFDQSTGFIFYSKEDVLQFLKTGERCSMTSNQERCYEPNSTDIVLAKIEYSPDGLPYGWLKVVKFRMNMRKGGTKSDLFFADPISGYTFRSMKDALNYVDAGIVGKLAFKPRIKTICHLFALEKESLGADERSSLYSDQMPNTDMVKEIEQLPESSDLQCFNFAPSPYIVSCTDIEHKDGLQRKRKKSITQIYAHHLEEKENRIARSKIKKDIRACQIL